MSKAKRTVFATIGWLVWKILSLFGLKFAKKKLQSNEKASRR